MPCENVVDMSFRLALGTDASSSPTDSPASAMYKPLSIQHDEKADTIIVIILIDDLPEGAEAIRLPSGEIIPIGATQTSLELHVSPRDINDADELVLIALNEEHTPMGSYLVDLSDETWQNGTSNGKAGLGPMIWGIAAGVFVIVGAMTAMFILLDKKK